MSSTGGIETVDSYRKLMQNFVESWLLTGARLTIIAAISLMVLFGLGLSDQYRSANSDGEFLQVDFNMSFPEVPCKFASVDVRDAFGMNMLNVTKTFRKYTIDSQTQEVVEELGEGSVVLNSHNFDRILEQHPFMVINFYTTNWCFWSDYLKPRWEEAAKIMGERYGTEAGKGILVGDVDCVEESGLCRRYSQNESMCLQGGFPSIRIFRNGSNIIGKSIHGYDLYESYYGYWDTESLVKMMETLLEPVSLQSQTTSESKKRGCRIEGAVCAKKVTRNVIGSARSATDGARVYIDFKTRAGIRKFLDH